MSSAIAWGVIGIAIFVFGVMSVLAVGAVIVGIGAAVRRLLK